MKNRRVFLALLMALMVSVMATSFIYSRIKHQFAKAASAKIVASARPLEAGTQSSQSNSLWSSGRSIFRSRIRYTKPEDVVGRILLYPFPEGTHP